MSVAHGCYYILSVTVNISVPRSFADTKGLTEIN